MNRSTAPELAPDAPIAAFDVDGTLTWTDSFVLFLRWVAGTGRFGLTMASVAPALLAYRLGIEDRDHAKAAIVGGFLGGMNLSAYQAACAAYAAATYPLILRDDGVAAVQAHRRAGHRVVLVSASLEDYLVHLAAMIGADAVVATRLGATGSDGVLMETSKQKQSDRIQKSSAQLRFLGNETRTGPVLSGALAGQNCWGPQKVARLRAAFPSGRIIAAYGDSRGDRELLEAARAGGGQGHLCLFKDEPEDKGAVARRLWFAPRQSV